MLKSAHDLRSYKRLKLSNGLDIFLVFDQNRSEAAAAITIQSGHFNDDADCHGLGHLLEHMLFQGNQVEHTPNALNSELEEMGGSLNAETSSEFTSFFLDCPTNALPQVLPKFKNMLQAPLFSEKCIKHEIAIIDAEFHAKKHDELRRLFQVHKETCNPAHPFSKFSVGNHQVFDHFSISELKSKLMALHQSYFTPSNMALCIVSPIPLNSQQDLVEAVMSDWASMTPNAKKSTKYPKLYLDEHLGIKINIQPRHKIHRLIVSFPLPNTDIHFRTKPLVILSHLFGFEGEGGLLDFYKKNNWALSLSAGGGIEGSNFKDFNINIQLTKEGTNNIEPIVSAIFRFIQLIHDEGIAPWRIAEVASIEQSRWDFSEPSKTIDEALHLSRAMFEYPEDYVLAGDYVLDNPDASIPLSLLADFRPANMRLKFISPLNPALNQAKWYDTPYSVEKLNTHLFTQSRSTDIPLSAFSLPPPNPFIASTLVRPEITKRNDLPRPIIDESGLDIWFGQDGQFNQPKGDCFLSFDCEAVEQGIEIVTAKKLWVALLNEKLNQRYYQANLAGMNFHFYPHLAGFSLQTNGFSQNQLAFYTKLLTQVILTDDFNPLFDQIKDRQVKGLSNNILTRPINGLFTKLAMLMQKHNYLPADMSVLMQNMTKNDILAAKDTLLHRFHVQGLMYGSWSAQEANETFNALKQFRNKHKACNKIKRGVTDLRGLPTVVHKVESHHTDNAVAIYYQANNASIKTIALTMLTEQFLASPFFQYIRNDKQLGYIVGSGYIPYNQHPGLALYVQSPHASPEHIVDEIHTFLDILARQIHQSEEIWRLVKSTTIKQLSDAEHNIGMKSQRLWMAIGNGDRDFSYNVHLIDTIQGLKIADLSCFILSLINKKRIGKAIVYSSTAHNLPLNERSKTVDNVNQFKDSASYV